MQVLKSKTAGGTGQLPDWMEEVESLRRWEVADELKNLLLAEEQQQAVKEGGRAETIPRGGETPPPPHKSDNEGKRFVF